MNKMIAELRMLLAEECLYLAVRLAPSNDEGAVLAGFVYGYCKSTTRAREEPPR